MSLSQKEYLEKVLRDYDIWSNRVKAVNILIKIDYLEAVSKGFKVVGRYLGMQLLLS